MFVCVYQVVRVCLCVCVYMVVSVGLCMCVSGGSHV